VSERIKVERLIKQISDQEREWTEHLASIQKTYLEPEESFFIPLSVFFKKSFTLMKRLWDRLVYLIK